MQSIPTLSFVAPKLSSCPDSSSWCNVGSSSPTQLNSTQLAFIPTTWVDDMDSFPPISCMSWGRPRWSILRINVCRLVWLSFTFAVYLQQTFLFFYFIFFVVFFKLLELDLLKLVYKGTGRVSFFIAFSALIVAVKNLWSKFYCCLQKFNLISQLSFPLVKILVYELGRSTAFDFSLPLSFDMRDLHSFIGWSPNMKVFHT